MSMETGAFKLLETATTQTLHAHNFSRSSTQATVVLTDLLARYMALLTRTCAQYAEHAGRTSLSVRDAVGALDELGVDVDELREFARTEGAEMARYVVRRTPRRKEDEITMRALLAQGNRVKEEGEGIRLEYREAPEEILEIEDEDIDMESGEEEGEDVKMDDEFDFARMQRWEQEPPEREEEEEDEWERNPIPPRQHTWTPPPHVPAFLPPFPSAPALPESSRPASPTPLPASTSQPSTSLVPPLPEQMAAVGTAAAAPSDYNTRVPYEQSSLALQPEWHLHFTSPPSPPLPSQSYPLPQKDRALYAAYHGLLTSAPDATAAQAGGQGRHRVAMALLELVSGQSGKGRWDLPDTLFGSVAANRPRVAVMPPSHPVPLPSANKDKSASADGAPKLPVTAPTMGVVDSGWAMGGGVEALVNMQAGRIGVLAKEVLPGPVHDRFTRLKHPPALKRDGRELTYGPGAPAPWNSESVAPPPGTKGTVKQRTVAPVLPDARLYATWEVERRDPRVPFANAGAGGTEGGRKKGRAV